ncbi:transcription factor bHLH128-like [Juglans microcarpa x Juglans regia]|uniref:transcription factor bHLH128-like n=1 Tax=Juglans microcarpa x Juglans regia TaxID=2249226 RepID=UPI001B7E166C|nr:transcription factor bHLH128-like [Juglans microcarpa x Juglans regia]
MYPPSSSPLSSQKPMGPAGLTRYGSAPSSLLGTAVDSLIGPNREFSALPSSSSLMAHHQYFSGDSSSVTSESSCRANSSNCPKEQEQSKGLQRSYGLNEMAVGDFLTTSNIKSGGGGSGGGSSASASASSALVRQRSSPAGLLNHLASVADNGFSVTRGSGGYTSQVGSNSGHGVSRLKPQLSFTRQDSLSQISEVSEDVVDGINSDNGHQNAMHSYATNSFGMDSWDNTNSIIFSAPPGVRAKNADNDIFNCLHALETQFSMPQTTLEMATVEKLIHIPEDSVPCKIRAKRGCATHPRSIAERERRTRISGKLKKLQDLVPNMDKQTSYADMLDLAVQHIKGLQNQVQELQKELQNCTCGCKQTA